MNTAWMKYHDIREGSWKLWYLWYYNYYRSVNLFIVFHVLIDFLLFAGKTLDIWLYVNNFYAVADGSQISFILFCCHERSVLTKVSHIFIWQVFVFMKNIPYAQIYILRSCTIMQYDVLHIAWRYNWIKKDLSIEHTFY